MAELRRVSVIYDICNDRTEVRHRAGDFEDYCEIDRDVTQDEERLAITDQIAALNFKRWQVRRSGVEPVAETQEKQFCDMDGEERLVDLTERVNKFNMLQLPGQPQGMHRGTAYLIGDLWNELYPVLVERSSK